MLDLGPADAVVWAALRSDRKDRRTGPGSWGDDDGYRARLQQPCQARPFEPRQTGRQDHAADGAVLQHVEDLADGVGTGGRDGLDVVGVQR